MDQAVDLLEAISSDIKKPVLLSPVMPGRRVVVVYGRWAPMWKFPSSSGRESTLEPELIVKASLLAGGQASSSMIGLRASG